jgi:hypothetical protein
MWKTFRPMDKHAHSAQTKECSRRNFARWIPNKKSVSMFDRSSIVDLPTNLPFQPIRMSVERYHELLLAGAFTEHDRVELLHGIVTEQMSKNPPHGTATRKCDLKLSSLAPAGWHVRNQEPITLETSEPEPDLAIVSGKLEDYSLRHPGLGDVGLVVEISDTTLVTDRFKAEIYASASIPTYWLVNLTEQTIEVHSLPEPMATPPSYHRVTIYRRGDRVPVILDGQTLGLVAVDELLP